MSGERFVTPIFVAAFDLAFARMQPWTRVRAVDVALGSTSRRALMVREALPQAPVPLVLSHVDKTGKVQSVVSFVSPVR